MANFLYNLSIYAALFLSGKEMYLNYSFLFLQGKKYSFYVNKNRLCSAICIKNLQKFF